MEETDEHTDLKGHWYLGRAAACPKKEEKKEFPTKGQEKTAE